MKLTPTRDPIWTILLIVLLFRIAYGFFLLPPVIVAADSPSYLGPSQTAFVDLLYGKPDLIRTPGYPLFLALMRTLFGEDRMLAGAVGTQRLLSILSVFFFYRTASLLLKRRGVVVFATLFYGCLPALLSYNAAILTESLAVSCSVFFFYFLIAYDRSSGWKTAFLLGLSVFFLIMLRPAFLFLLPLLIFYWTFRLISTMVRALRLKRKRVDARWRQIACVSGLLGTFVSLLLVLGYCELTRRQHGIFQITVVPYLNQFHGVIQSGLYRHGSDPVWNERIQASIDRYQREHPDEKPGPAWLFATGLSDAAFEEVGWNQLEHYLRPANRLAVYTTETIKANRGEYARYLLGKFRGISSVRISHLVTSNMPEWKEPQKRLAAAVNFVFAGYLTFGLVFALLTVEAVLILAVWRRNGRPPWNRGLLWLWIFSSFFTAVVGAVCDWPRMVLPAMPFVILLAAHDVDLAFRFAQMRRSRIGG